MSLDPQIEIVIGLVKKANAPEFWQLTPDQAREQYLLRVDKLKVREPIHRSEDRRIPGPGSHIPIRIYRPREPHAGEKLPALVWYHGGGFVIGNLEVADKPCRQLANATGAVVVSVDYRLAPEAKAPAGAEDCYAATAWVAENAAAVGGDIARLGVSGDSAGGGLAQVVTLMCRDRGGPALQVQLLMYPMSDAGGEYPSRLENAEGYLFTAADRVWFGEQYLDKPADAENPYISPIRALDHSGLSPAALVTAGYDPRRVRPQVPALSPTVSACR